MCQWTSQLLSTITCPQCNHSQQEEMPTTACQFFYECTHCKTVLKPLIGDCCVSVFFNRVVQKNCFKQPPYYA
ncbi:MULTISPECIES: GDCCVxC domain-containing (seleno)protein [Gammaproteobacteria]|uniref:GDCCVxC domain-containing (seleno)protein n=1 Tax=Gammaproteobacteria TaxID=1236 RepID=UPI0024BD506C|nr:GDCCVxC domain-containing (seleno)protein [Pseudoalteromonas prydzensis]